MDNYTIVSPGFEFIPPPTEENYLEFLELCTRVCYRSEDSIRPGSAEKLMNKVVKGYEHYSVTEHANCILKLSSRHLDNNAGMNLEEATLDMLIEANPLLSGRISVRGAYETIVSGNIRMWVDAVKNRPDYVSEEVREALHLKWPFFFPRAKEKKGERLIVEVLDENPITNKSGLSRKEMMKHCTLTYKGIMSRDCSHQWVRHRFFAFSQSSQRYINYGKKNFQFIIPPAHEEIPSARERFINDVLESYSAYLSYIDDGIKPEDARAILPNATATEVVTTGTLEYWAHVLEHRAHNPRAQGQIRDIMLGIEDHMGKTLGWNPHRVRYENKDSFI